MSLSLWLHDSLAEIEPVHLRWSHTGWSVCCSLFPNTRDCGKLFCVVLGAPSVQMPVAFCITSSFNSCLGLPSTIISTFSHMKKSPLFAKSFFYPSSQVMRLKGVEFMIFICGVWVCFRSSWLDSEEIQSNNFYS